MIKLLSRLRDKFEKFVDRFDDQMDDIDNQFNAVDVTVDMNLWVQTKLNSQYNPSEMKESRLIETVEELQTEYLAVWSVCTFLRDLGN